MRIDLHTHSVASDGTDTPAALVEAASAAGLDVVAITDHDTASGWVEAEEAARRTGIELVRGMEISTRHEGVGVHLLAYLPDPGHPALDEALSKILAGRNSRVPAMLERLRGLGIAIEASDVRRVAPGTAATGRPHVADALVDLGVVADRTEAFRRFLNPGRPAYVDRYAASLLETMDVVAQAGGVCVIAHPWGRHGPHEPDEATLAELTEAGLAGIEVDHQDHDAHDRERLRAIAGNLGLLVTGSSDYHGMGKRDHDLGCNTTAPEEYARLLELAAAAAQRSGRAAPGVVRP
ncbi:PHP domain-containing protein [Nocardioides sp. cx-173]|uniref:PHP domain-containing protein n=1 Tax=Nocardioides sp. cx-173 TaxID=2898796 RepID=UPI001E5486A7|nr:PHP domain-containing protein [Nocardioides sp. cx-173]MCD4525384.1 PHP domain-containing protein [Nocardioides sp. cx-173]UGB40820.1 PHP domain-containing protein [Nocardioides sp. cx-173]